MDDQAVDAYITKRIEKRGITVYDMLAEGDVDPAPQIGELPFPQRVRPNRFSCPEWDLRLCELLTHGRFDPENPYRKLGVPLKDLVRYWWDNCVDQEAFLERALEDILLIYKDRMLPEEKEEKPADTGKAFDGIAKSLGSYGAMTE